jgi:hypothetical protein
VCVCVCVRVRVRVRVRVSVHVRVRVCVCACVYFACAGVRVRGEWVCWYVCVGVSHSNTKRVTHGA